MGNRIGICESQTNTSQRNVNDDGISNGQMIGPSSKYQSGPRQLSKKPSQETISLRNGVDKNTTHGSTISYGASFYNQLGFGGTTDTRKKGLKVQKAKEINQKWQIDKISESETSYSGKLSDRLSQRSSQSHPQSSNPQKQADPQFSTKNPLSRSKSVEDFKCMSMGEKSNEFGSEENKHEIQDDNDQENEQLQPHQICPKRIKKELNPQRQKILHDLLEDDGESAGDCLSGGENILDTENFQLVQKYKHHIQKKKTEAEIGRDRHIVNFYKLQQLNRRFMNDEEQDGQNILPPQNILEELRLELNLTDQESIQLANYISQAEMTDENGIAKGLRKRSSQLFGNIGVMDGSDRISLRHRSYSNVFDQPMGLKQLQNNDQDASDPDSFGLSRIDGDLSSVHKLKQVVMQLNYQTQTENELYSAFEESNKFESDIDFDLKSFLKQKKQSRFQTKGSFKIKPTPARKDSENLDELMRQNLQSSIDDLSAFGPVFNISRKGSERRLVDLDNDDNTSKKQQNLDKTVENVKSLPVITEVKCENPMTQRGSSSPSHQSNQSSPLKGRTFTEIVQQSERQGGSGKLMVESTRSEKYSPLVSPELLPQLPEKQKWFIKNKQYLQNVNCKDMVCQKRPAFQDDPVNEEFLNTEEQGCDGYDQRRASFVHMPKRKQGAAAKKKLKKHKKCLIENNNEMSIIAQIKALEAAECDTPLRLKLQRKSSTDMNLRETVNLSVFSGRKQSADHQITKFELLNQF